MRFKTKNINKSFIKIVLILSLAIFILLGYMLYQNSNKLFDKQWDEYDVDIFEKYNIKCMNSEYQSSQLYIWMKDINEDVIGIIRIDDEIVQPIVQGENNEEYVRKNIYGDYHDSGTVYLDYRNNIDDKNLVIYGHTHLFIDGSMFSNLNNYLDEDYYNAHKTVEIEFEDEIRKYEIFSVYIWNENDGADFMTVDFSENSIYDYDVHLETMVKNSIYDNPNINIDSIDQIVTLVTCYKQDISKKIIIVAKR